MYFKLTLILIIFSLSGFSQSEKVLLGKIIDGNSKKPLGYVNVTCGNLGVYSNLDGDFNLIIPVSSSMYDTIVLSFIGYDSKKILIDTISTGRYDIELTRNIIMLKEVIIRSKAAKMSAIEIVKRAIDKLPYSTVDKDFVLESFLRQKHYFINTKSNKTTYLRYIEAAGLVENKKEGYNFIIKEVRRSNDFRQTERFNQTHDGNNPADNIENNFLKLDRIKPIKLKNIISSTSLLNPYIGRLNNDFITQHKFKLDSITSYNNELIYVIKVLPSKKSIYLKTVDGSTKKYYIPIGKLFITGNDFSILEFQYSYVLNPKTNNNSTVKLLKFSYQGNVLFRDIIKYKKFKGGNYLSYLMRERGSSLFIGGSKASGLMKKSKQKYSIEEDEGYFRVKQELVVTKVIEHKNSLPQSYYIEKYSTIFPRKYEYNKLYWETHNTLLHSLEDEKLLIDLGKGKSLEEQFFRNGREL